MKSIDITWHSITDLDSLEEFWPEWDHIVKCSQVDPLFNSSDWLRNWMVQFWQSDWTLTIQVAKYETTVIAIIPLYLQPAKNTAFPLGQGEPEIMEVASEYLDIIVLPEWFDELKPALLKRINAVAARLQWRALLGNAYLLKLLNGQAMKVSHASRYLTDTSSFKRQDLSKNTRSQINKAFNKLNALDGVKLRWANPEEYPALFQELKDLHDKRWEKANKPGAFQSETFLAFHHSVLSQADAAAISVLEIEGRTVAIHYFLKGRDTLYFYQTGWEVDGASKFSPGLILHLWSIENTNLSFYDFMMGSKKSYKSKLSSMECDMVSITVFISRSARCMAWFKQFYRSFFHRK